MPELITNETTFNDKTRGPHLTVVHFAAEWAEQCQQVDDFLDTLAKQPDYANVVFLKCLAEELSSVSLKYKIEAVPTVVLIKSGASVDRIDGVHTSKIAEKVKEFAAKSTATGDELPLEVRLKALVNQATIMLFMKGDKKTPRCGFSKTMIEILNSTGLEYDTFDILVDEEVRQGLKKYSDWPTYPQLYVKGELIGGLDIVKEIQASGELLDTLKG